MAVSLLRSFAIAALVFQVAQAGADPTPAGSLSAELCEDSLSFRFSADEGPPTPRFAAGLDSGAGTYDLSACLSIASGSPAGAGLPRGLGLSAGTGSVEGSLRFLADPGSPSFLADGYPVILDYSLRSRSAVLRLDAGPLCLFAAQKGEGAFSFASGPDAGRREPGPAAGGASLRWGFGESRLEALAAASYGDGPSEGSGWAASLSSSPALDPSDGSPLAQAALLWSRDGDGGDALCAGAFSYGRLFGPGLAARLEARESAGPLSLRLLASAASPRYRALFAERQDRLAAACAEARLAMRRSSSLGLSFSEEAMSRGLFYSPSWDGKAALDLVLPLGAKPGRLFETKLSLPLAAADEAGEGSWSVLLRKKSRSPSASTSSSLEASILWSDTFGGLSLDFSARAAGEGGLPAIALDLSLELFAEGSAASPVIAEGWIELSLPWGSSGSLSLKASLPEAGTVLAPVLSASRSAGAESGRAFALSLGYEARIGHPRAKP